MASSSTAPPSDDAFDGGEYDQTVILHGREFQCYAIQNGVYFAPVDEDETERLNIQYNVMMRAFGGDLILTELRSPRRVLECGFGTGCWARDVGLRYPRCEVTALDITTHMLYLGQLEAPENVEFEVGDLNARFTFPSNYFDLVNSQLMAGGIHANRWESYLRDIYRVLCPGGYCQMAEIYFMAQSDNGTISEGHALQRWSRAYIQSLQPYKNPRVPMQLERLMRRAGFTHISGRLVQLPMSGWSSDAQARMIGIANRDNVNRLLSSLAIYPLTEFQHMTDADVQFLAAQARLEADDQALKAYFPLYIVTGQKPR